MKRLVTVLALAGVVAACDAVPLEPEPAGLLRASIEGSVQASYQGTGQFRVGSRGPAGAMTYFSLRSVGQGEGRDQALILTRLGGGLPTAGRYALGAGAEFSARYERVAGSVREGYQARDGEMEITAATPERMEGTFRFTAVRSCTGSLAAMTCRIPAPADAATVVVTGSFRAVPGDDSRAGLPGL